MKLFLLFSAPPVGEPERWGITAAFCGAFLCVEGVNAFIDGQKAWLKHFYDQRADEYIALPYYDASKYVPFRIDFDYHYVWGEVSVRLDGEKPAHTWGESRYIWPEGMPDDKAILLHRYHLLETEAI